MGTDQFQYEIPNRPIYEGYASLGWVAAAGVSSIVGTLSGLPNATFEIAGSVALAMAATRGYQAYLLHRKRNNLVDDSVDLINFDGLQVKAKAVGTDRMWIGKGFIWDVEQTQLAHDIISQGSNLIKGPKGSDDSGAYWLHGIGGKEEDKSFPLPERVGHALICGTTRVGKTRLIDLMSSQDVMRKECVIVLDPKGDQELRDNLKRACERAGHPEKFFWFHPAHAESCSRVDPLRNWNRVTELASRVSALVPSEGGGDAFTAFGWQALNNVLQAATMIGERVNLRGLRRYIEGGVDKLLERALRVYFERNVESWDTRISSYLQAHKNRTLEAYISFYKQEVMHEQASSEIDGLMSLHEHNRDHFSKMVASLIPILNMLTSGPIGDLLSPEPSPDDQRPVWNSADAINNGFVLYIGLDSLSDSTVGSAIGSILAADIVSVAGDRYNYGVNNTPVNIYIDEAAEVLNKPIIQLLNKGGGAGFRMTLAMQTIADISARLGSRDLARQVIGNMNTRYILRIQDGETQKYFAELLPEVPVKSLEVNYRHDVESRVVTTFEGAYGESLKTRNVRLFSPEWFGILPKLHMLTMYPGGKLAKLRIPVLTD